MIKRLKAFILLVLIMNYQTFYFLLNDTRLKAFILLVLIVNYQNNQRSFNYELSDIFYFLLNDKKVKNVYFTSFNHELNHSNEQRCN